MKFLVLIILDVEVGLLIFVEVDLDGAEVHVNN